MAEAVTRATFSDFRLIKGRKVAQFVFEVAAEQADDALDALGGLPRADVDRWCAIARLSESGLALSPGGQVDRTDTPQPVNGADGPPSPSLLEQVARQVDQVTGISDVVRRPRTPFHSKPLSQQAAILSRDTAFQLWASLDPKADDAQLTAEEWLKEKLGIRSFKRLDTQSNAYDPAKYELRQLVEDFEKATGRLRSDQ